MEQDQIFSKIDLYDPQDVIVAYFMAITVISILENHFDRILSTNVQTWTF